MTVKLNAADLVFILRQIKISEAHAAGTALTDVWVDAAGNVVPQGTEGALPAISDPHVPYGLRTVDGTYNNVVAGRESWVPPIRPCRACLTRTGAMTVMATPCRCVRARGWVRSPTPTTG